MGKHQRQYTREYKQEAVGLMETSGKPVAVIARELGINANLLYRWRQEFGQPPQEKTESEMSASELAAELKRLRRENEVLRQERDILKKAISILGPERP
jgi:transposase